jgi:hypothetical protein
MKTTTEFWIEDQGQGRIPVVILYHVIIHGEVFFESDF